MSTITKIVYKKRETGDLVFVVDRSEGKVFFKYAGREDSVYSLKEEDFEKRFFWTGY